MMAALTCIFRASFAVWLFFLGGLDAFTTNKVENIEFCNSEVCREVADAITNSMNKSVDPCVDFYEFSCGSWESNNPKPSYKPSWSTMNKVTHLAQIRLRDELEKEASPEEILPIQLIKKYHRSCMDNETRESEGLTRIAAILRETNGWPMIMNNGTWNEDAMTWQEIDHYYENLIGGCTFYNLYNYNSPTLPNQLWVDKPTFPQASVELRNYTGPFGILYRSLIKNIAQSLIRHNNANVSNESLEKNIDDLLKFEENVYKVSKNSRNIEYSSRLSKLLADWPVFNAPYIPQGRIKLDLAVFDQSIIVKNQVSNHKFESRMTMVLKQAVFRLESRLLFSGHNIVAVESKGLNYIQWYHLSKILPYTTLEIEDMFFEFGNGYWGTRGRPPRSLQCSMSMNREHAAAYLFIKKYWRNDTKKTTMEMTRNIRRALERQINNSNWLPTEGKNAVIEKLNHLEFMLGYPDWYDDGTALVDYYKGLTVGESYFENALKFMEHGWKMCINDFDKPAALRTCIKENYSSGLLQTQATTFQQNLFISISAALLEFPSANERLPDSVRYGALSTSSGHEMGHIVGPSGTDFGADVTEPLFARDLKKIYLQHFECFVDAFDDYFECEGNTQKANVTKNHNNSSKGRLTLEENFADWSGLQATFNAYKEVKDRKKSNGELKLPGLQQFTDDQMFFISFAQIWCSGKNSESYERNVVEHDAHSRNNIRVIGTVSQTPAFAEAFKCLKNSPMNLETKCNMWMDQTVKS